MNFVEDIRVRKESAETGFCAEIDRPPTVLDVWEIGRIGVAENTSAKGDEAFWFLLF